MDDALLFGSLLPALGFAAAAAVAWLSVRAEARSGDRLAARRAEQPLAHELPYWVFLEDGGAGVAVHVDLTYSCALELHGVDTDCLDNETLNQLSAGLHGILQNLPAGTVLQFIHTSDDRVEETVARYRAVAKSTHAIGRELVEAKASELLAHAGLRRTRLLLVIATPNPSDGVKGLLPKIARRFGSVDAAVHEGRLRTLRTIRDQVSRGMVALGLRSRVLDSRALRRLAYEWLNPGRAQIVPDPFSDEAPGGAARTWADLQTAREQLALTGVAEHQRHLVVGDRLVRVVTLRSLPTWTEPALFEALVVALPFHCRVTVALEALDSLKALDELKRRRDQARMMASLKQKRNQEAEAQQDDVEDLIDKNLRSSVRMMRVSLSVVLCVDAALPEADAVLDRQAAEVLRLLAQLHGAQGMIDEYAQLDEWLATLPGNAMAGRRWRRCTSENAAHLLLAWQSWSGSEEPLVLVQNGRGHLVGLNPFEPTLDNPNAFMAGASGSGKSTTTNYLLLNLIATGAGALVVDIGGSYRRLLEIFGGTYFALADGHALNLFFDPTDIVDADGHLDDERAQFIAAVVERMVCHKARPELLPAERAVVAAAIEATYERCADRTPILGDLYEVLRAWRSEDVEDVRMAQDIARQLAVWIKGPQSRYVNRTSTIKLTTDLAAFDLKGLDGQEHLRDVLVIILSGVIWNLVRSDRGRRKIVVFDEVWKFLASPASAQLIAELYRTSRKYHCSILTISQSVEDFTGSPIASALVNNSATTYLLRHRRGHHEVAQAFKLNPRELHVFESLEMRRGEYTEALMLHGDAHFLGRVALTPLEYWIATTHPPDLELEARWAQRYPHLTRLELLKRLAAALPTGAAAPEASKEAA
jgi:type IV secretory pathway VirB4 component